MMGMLNQLGSIPKRQAASAPSADNPSRVSTSPSKRRKRSDGAPTEDGSVKKSRQQSRSEREET
ncbi:hypothetical protein DOTSEDRAFT_67500 [Dothistroma septosporum NZE10]|uniref:Uncharacterized protein n=1 Tax=Dothistroma septosporum (strain NZE10 / CBS 128990) TaxID=675120 RepID=N1Q1W4_DOTSN|nr:hypothetical protein DOTSEDRAFT_67500 [Dothistroma septosporum NZE10]